MDERAANRKKLREKIREKRNGGTNASQAEAIRRDPQTALLQMGVDDPVTLSMAKNMVKNPQAFLQTMRQMVAEEKNDSEEEEAPPPLPTAAPSQKAEEEEVEEGPPPQ